MTLPDGTSCSCKIVEAKDDPKHVLAFCGEPVPGRNCGFFMNLTTRRQSTTYFSDYDGFPTLASGKKPCVETLVRAFRLPTMRNDQMGEYFEGFLGEHISMYPGVEQLSLAGESKRTKTHFNEALRLFLRTPLPPVEQGMGDPQPGTSRRAHPYRPMSISAPMTRRHSTPISHSRKLISSLSVAATRIRRRRVHAVSTTASQSSVSHSHEPSSPILNSAPSGPSSSTPTPMASSSSSSAKVYPEEQEKKLIRQLWAGEGVDFGDFQNLTK
ncbi:hypothetical protein C0993_000639, partial [Termitomyces sp. T159_Od127]